MLTAKDPIALSLNVKKIPKTCHGLLFMALAFAILIWLLITFFVLFLMFFVVVAAFAVVRLLLYTGSKKDITTSCETLEPYISEKNGTKHTAITIKQYNRSRSHD